MAVVCFYLDTKNGRNDFGLLTKHITWKGVMPDVRQISTKHGKNNVSKGSLITITRRFNHEIPDRMVCKNALNVER